MQKKKRDFLFDTHNSNHGFCFGGVVVVIKELLTKNFINFFLFLLQFHDDADKKKLMIHIHDTMFCSQEVGNGLGVF